MNLERKPLSVQFRGSTTVFLRKSNTPYVMSGHLVTLHKFVMKFFLVIISKKMYHQNKEIFWGNDHNKNLNKLYNVTSWPLVTLGALNFCSMTCTSTVFMASKNVEPIWHINCCRFPSFVTQVAVKFPCLRFSVKHVAFFLVIVSISSTGPSSTAK